MNVHEGQVEIVVPVSVAGATAGARSVRARVVFQVCREAAAVCDRPEAVVLDAPFEVAR